MYELNNEYYLKFIKKKVWKIQKMLYDGYNVYRLKKKKGSFFQSITSLQKNSVKVSTNI